MTSSWQRPNLLLDEDHIGLDWCAKEMKNFAFVQFEKDSNPNLISEIEQEIMRGRDLFVSKIQS